MRRKKHDYEPGAVKYAKDELKLGTTREFTVLPVDNKNATPSDPRDCPFNHCVERSIALPWDLDVSVGKTMVQVSAIVKGTIENPELLKSVMRGRPEQKLRDAIDAWDDKGEPFPPGKYKLLGLSPSQTRAAVKMKNGRRYSPAPRKSKEDRKVGSKTLKRLVSSRVQRDSIMARLRRYATPT